MGKARKYGQFDFARDQKRQNAENAAWNRQNKAGVAGMFQSHPGNSPRDVGGGNNRDTKKLTLEGGIMRGPIAYLNHTVIIDASNQAILTTDGTLDQSVRGLIYLSDVTSSTLDEMKPNRRLGDVIYLVNAGSGNITITHNTLVAGQFLCPGEVDFILGVQEVAVAVMNTLQGPTPTWNLLGSTGGGPPFADDIFEIFDNSDTTKKLVFSLASMTASTTSIINFISTAGRTYTFPDATGTVALLSRANTWSGLQTFDDTTIEIVDDVTASKKLIFSLASGTGTHIFNFITTAGRTFTFPDATGTVALLSRAASWSGAQTFQDGNLLVGDAGASNTLLLKASGMTADKTATFPDNTGTVAELNLAQTWTAIQTFPATGIAFPDGSISNTSNDLDITGSAGNKVNLTISGSGDFVTADGSDSTVKIHEFLELAPSLGVRGQLGAGFLISYQLGTTALSVGTAGTIEIPTLNESIPATKAAIDTDFGDIPGCIGAYINTTLNTSSIMVRQADGNWSGVSMVHNLVT